MEVRLHIRREDNVDDFVIMKADSLEQAIFDYLGKEFCKYYPLHKKEMLCIVLAVEEIPNEKL